MCVLESVVSRAQGRRQGFSLAELLIVVVCIGLLGGIAAGGFSGMVRAGREEAAVGKARLINAARCSYGLVVADAEQRWSEAGDDDGRLALLRSAGLIDGTAQEMLYSDGGYALGLSGALRERTILTHKGEAVAYR